jgi:hypothetical protein
MSITRNTSVATALVTGASALAMLTGLNGARADELQANQQLLNQRIDQLASVGQFSGPSVQFTTDTNPGAGQPVQGGSFPRSILIPGTDTSLKVYGQITEITDYWMSGGTPNASPQNTTVGPTGQLESISLEGTVGQARSNGIFQTTPRESRIGFETRTPTPFGEARTLMEFDWAGSSAYAPGGGAPLQVSDSLIPRIRYAYGTLGGLLAGQATSNFSDPDANPNLIDFGGEAGTPGVVRAPQIRYTMPAWYGAALSVSAETPQTDLATGSGLLASDAGVSSAAMSPGTNACVVSTTPASACTVGALYTVNPAKSTAPDVTAAYYLPQPWGHLDLSVVVRPGMEISDGHFFAKDYIGYGGHVGADFKPGWFGWIKDDFVGQVEAGDGMGRYLNASDSPGIATNYGATATTYGSNLAGAPTTAAAAALIRGTTVNEFGYLAGYQHWWLDNLNSTFSGGYSYFDIPAALVAKTTTLNKELITAHANIIWNPVSFVDVGLEFMYGQRTALTNAHAQENVLISEFKFRF